MKNGYLREIEGCEERIYKTSDEFYNEIYMIGLKGILKEVQLNPIDVLYIREDKKYYFFKKRATGEYIRIKKDFF